MEISDLVGKTGGNQNYLPDSKPKTSRPAKSGINGIIWTRHDHRSYQYQTAKCQAFLFGASRPVQMWAWVVFCRSGRAGAGGVEQGFRTAKREAANAIRQIDCI